MTIDNGNEYHLDHEYIIDSKSELEGLFNKLKYAEKTEKKIERKIIYPRSELENKGRPHNGNRNNIS